MPLPASVNPQNLPIRDIHLPEPVSWWPPAPGWWMLLGVVLVLMALLVWFWHVRARRRYQRLALRELEQLVTQAPAEVPILLSQLLRRVALCYFPRSECAGLTGEDWLVFLDRPFADQPFSKGEGRCLLDAPYRPDVAVDHEALIELGRRWLKQLPLRSHSAGRQR